MTTFKRITKAAARKLFAAGDQPFYVCPCKMRPGMPWNMAALIFGKEYLENAERYAPTPERTSDLWKGTIAGTAWDLFYNNWAFYNATGEKPNNANVFGGFRKMAFGA